MTRRRQRTNEARFERATENSPTLAVTEYLVSDVEELVNERIDEYLDGYPFDITVTDFQPRADTKEPLGIRRIENTYLSKVSSNHHEFTGMDIRIQFPVVPTADNPLNITLKWEGGMQCRVAIVDRLPILLIEDTENTEKTLLSALLSAKEMTSFLNSCGLPESIWQANLEELLIDIHDSRDIQLHRRSQAIVDPYTNMEIIHDARYMTNDIGEKELVQELCLNIDHLDDGVDAEGNEIGLPPKSVYRNMLRFERTEDGALWSYRGAYEGKLESGDIIDEIVQLNPKLGIPKDKVIDKALSVLSESPY